MRNKKQIILLIVLFASSALLIGGFSVYRLFNTKKSQDESNKKYENFNSKESIKIKPKIEISLGVMPKISDFTDKNLEGTIKLTKDDKEISEIKYIGEYQALLTINNKEYNSLVNVIDNEAPILKLKEVKISENAKYKIEDFISSCHDNSGDNCILNYENSNNAKYTKAGTYNISISATDKSGNEVMENTKLVINKKASSKPKPSSSNENNKPEINESNNNTPNKDSNTYNTDTNNDKNQNTENNNENSNITDTENNNKNDSENKEPELIVVDTKPEKEIIDTKEKYGVKINTIKTTIYDYYNDGSKKENNSTTEIIYDKSGYQATTNDLVKEATSLAKSNEKNTNEVLKYVNEYRREVGADELVIDETLTKAATIRALEMAYSGKFSHTRPDGTMCYTILSDLSYNYLEAAENIASGQSTPAMVASAWKNSQGHYENMISTNFSKIGIGYVYIPDTHEYYWVQLFSN